MNVNAAAYMVMDNQQQHQRTLGLNAWLTLAMDTMLLCLMHDSAVRLEHLTSINIQSLVDPQFQLARVHQAKPYRELTIKLCRAMCTSSTPQMSIACSAVLILRATLDIRHMSNAEHHWSSSSLTSRLCPCSPWSFRSFLHWTLCFGSPMPSILSALCSKRI